MRPCESTSSWPGQGAGLEYLDVGGGLGIDYDGSQTNFESSANYSLQEYANDVVYHIQSVCDDAGVKHPTIVSESGRAIVAYHSALVFNVLGVSGLGESDVPNELPDEAEQPIVDLLGTYQNVAARNLLESYHDAQQALEMAMSLFSGGYLPLDQRSLAENLFWAICRKMQRLVRAIGLRAGRPAGARRLVERHVLLQFFAVSIDARQLGHQAVVSRDADSPPVTNGPRTTRCWATSPATRTARSTCSSIAAT